MKSLWVVLVLVAGGAALADDGGCPVAQNIRGHENVEWSISYAFHLTDANKDLPRVLLVGDSICNGYQEKVRELTEGRCNISYWISSYCATSPEYLRLLAFHLDAAKYDVVHFNNGLHSLDTDTASWAKALATAFRLIREKQPQAKVIWATSTPLKDAQKTAKARELNAAAEPVVRSFGDIETDDLFALLDPLDRETCWSDVYHHKEATKILEAKQVVRFIVPELCAMGVTVNGVNVTDYERKTFADGEAIRYRLPVGVRHVTGEATQWTLPEDAQVWFQDEWLKTIHYEALYTNLMVGALQVGQRMTFPITAKLKDGTYRLITEANVVDYTDGCAVYLGKGRFGIGYYADTNGFDQVGADTTPWRVMLKAKDLQTLATSDIVRRLCPAPTGEVAAKCAAFVKPGRAVWQWLPAGDPVYGEQKDWYDRTKALGFEYYLIDDGWKTWRDGEMDQWACLKKWIDYGKSIGVESFMWVDSKEMLTPESRRAYLAKVKASGAVGIKIDFIPKPSYAQMKWYEETLAETLEFGLMTDFHGCVKPSGREKTWPHEVAREAIRGHEWHITRYDRVLPPEHDCILPFNRLVQGHADYTPMVFEKKELNGFTWARELAQGIIFSAPFLCFGDYPKNYLEDPAIELIKALPSVYDETRILPGSEIGECIAVAKRKGTDWFVAVENGAAARQLEIVLDFLIPGEYDVRSIADAADRPDAFAFSDETTYCGERLPVHLKPCGGFVAWLRRKPASEPMRIVLTFDDGYKDHLLIAAPELEKRGWRGVFNIVTDWIGRDDKFLSWEDVRELVCRGHEVTTHSVSHPSFTGLIKEGKRDVVRRELSVSRDLIADQTGFAPRLFCAPFIAQNAELAQMCRAENLRLMDVGRYNFGSDNQETVCDVLMEEVACGRKRMDLLHHGISAADNGGWSPFRDRASFARHLDRIAELERKGLVCVTDYDGCQSDCALKATDWPHHGVLALSFDDRHLAAWEAAFPLFARYGATATFCIAGAFDTNAVAFAKRALAEGHEIALHGLEHRNADQEVERMGTDCYWEREVRPQLDVCRAAGIPVRSFAYPNCRHNATTDALFARKGFTRLRGSIPGVANPNPHGPSDAKLDRWHPVAEADAFFVPAVDHLARRDVSNIVMGECYLTKADDILNAMNRAGVRAERLSIVSHGIAPDAKGISMKTEWLEQILAEANKAGVVVRGLR